VQLFHAPTSPFVRKVMVVAQEAGLLDAIEIVFNAASPVARDAVLAARNPLGKIPVLVLEDGSTLYDSRVICEYLAALGGVDTLFPPAGPARWQALTQQALGDGLLDAALVARYEAVMRPEELRWPAWREAQLAKIHGALEQIEALVPALGETMTIGTISLGCALGYLDFRYADLDWRREAPQAARWFAAFDARPSMAATRPRERTA
jgi:glutathione S-transferase